MKWLSHQIVTTTAVLAITGNPVMAVMAGGISPLPDKIDHFCGVYGRKPIRMFNHREHSHYWGYWLLIAVFSFIYMKDNGLLLTSTFDYVGVSRLLLFGDFQTVGKFLFPNIAFWGAVGCLFHIFEDFFSGMGVPLVTPTKLSPHIKLYTGGGFSEYFIVVLSSLFFVIFYMVPSSVRDMINGLFMMSFR